MSGRRSLLGAAVAHDDDAVGQRQRLVLAVGDEQRGDLQALLDVAHLLAQPLAQMLVEAGEGLVEEQDLRLEHQRAGERHALLLAAGKLVRQPGFVAGEADQLEHGLDLAANFGPRQAAQLQAEGDVLEDVHVGPERMALEHHAGRPPFRRKRGSRPRRRWRCGRRSGSRSRRSCAAASTCPSPTVRAGRSARRRRR